MRLSSTMTVRMSWFRSWTSRQTSFTIRKDPDGAFNSRYIMVTKDNVRDFIKEHRQMIKFDKTL